MGTGRRRRFLTPLLLWGVFAQPVAAEECRQDQVTITGDFGSARFTVEVADDPQERAQGLMHREKLASSAGMVFVYDAPQPMSFWMRNTLIELDLLFLDRFGEVKHIHHRAQPLDERPISGIFHDLFGVLEINGGMAERLGILIGSKLRHPAFEDRNNPWVC